MDEPAKLPTSGVLPKIDVPHVTNEDLLVNAFKQNETINYVVDSMKELKGEVFGLRATVTSHGSVIEQLEKIKGFLVWLLSFVGVGGAIELLNYFYPHK